VITRADVEHVARLARLALTPDELERMQAQLSGILEYIDKLAALDVQGVEPTSHAVPLLNVLRED
jgi:aspartyl-tRNA(Asn)/glutamyl-tRNA(Gln) amidotransferase subunit C